MIDVVGIGEDGPDGLSRSSRALVEGARVVIGGRRHLQLLAVVPGQERLTYPTPLRSALPALLQEKPDAVVLASGDPLRSGLGSVLIEELGADAVRIHPHVSSEALVRARMGWSAESSDVVTVVGRSVERIMPLVTPGARLVVLCSDGNTPSEVARLLVTQGAGASQLTAWWHLGAPAESGLEGSHSARADEWDDVHTPDLVTVAIEVEGVMAVETRGAAPGRDDDAFEHDGLITKRDIRASALARLRPLPGQLLWDLGAGSGAIGIEWCLAAERATAVSVDNRAERLERVRRNAVRFGVQHRLEAVESSTEAFVAQTHSHAPDAVMFGGGITLGVIEKALEHLAPHGRAVGHGVTLETEQVLLAAWQRWGGELTRISVERAKPLGSMSGFAPARTVTQWSFAKAGSNA